MRDIYGNYGKILRRVSSVGAVWLTFSYSHSAAVRGWNSRTEDGPGNADEAPVERPLLPRVRRPGRSGGM